MAASCSSGARPVMRVAELIACLICPSLAVLVACGPRSQATRRRELPNFFVVVWNSTSYPDEVTIRSGRHGLLRTNLKQVVPANGEAIWLLGNDQPDLIEIESLGLTLAYGPHDWRGGTGMKIRYPEGSYEPQYWPRLPE